MIRAKGREARRGQAWRILRNHYGARNAFQSIYRAYEARVARLVKKLGVPRDEIKLGVEETRRLFDTTRLHEMIDVRLQQLRDASHAYFRDQDVAEPYDSKVTRIYHELSILREEHLSVRNFPVEGGRAFARLFQEVSEYYPQRLRRVRDLFARAQKRLEELLPRFQGDPIVLRSAFLFRHELWPENDRAGLARMLDRMYPAEGAAHGFLQIARSFFRAGFFEYAAEAARMGVAVASKEAQARTSRALEVRETIRELDRLAARADAEQKALEELAAS